MSIPFHLTVPESKRTASADNPELSLEELRKKNEDFIKRVNEVQEKLVKINQ